MNFEDRLLFFRVGLDEQGLQVCIMLIVLEGPNHKQPGCIVMKCVADFPLDSYQLDVDEDGHAVLLLLFLLVQHLSLLYAAKFTSDRINGRCS